MGGKFQTECKVSNAELKLVLKISSIRDCSSVSWGLTSRSAATSTKLLFVKHDRLYLRTLLLIVTSQNSSFLLQAWGSLLVVGSPNCSLNFLTTEWDASIVSSEAIALRPSGFSSMRSGSRWALTRWMYTLPILFCRLKKLTTKFLNNDIDCFQPGRVLDFKY